MDSCVWKCAGVDFMLVSIWGKEAWISAQLVSHHKPQHRCNCSLLLIDMKTVYFGLDFWSPFPFWIDLLSQCMQLPRFMSQYITTSKHSVYLWARYSLYRFTGQWITQFQLITHFTARGGFKHDSIAFTVSLLPDTRRHKNPHAAVFNWKSFAFIACRRSHYVLYCLAGKDKQEVTGAALVSVLAGSLRFLCSDSVCLKKNLQLFIVKYFILTLAPQAALWQFGVSPWPWNSFV